MTTILFIKNENFCESKTDFKNSKNRKTGDNQFYIWIKNPPCKREANNAIKDIISEYLGVSKSRIESKQDLCSKNKGIEII